MKFQIGDIVRRDEWGVHVMIVGICNELNQWTGIKEETFILTPLGKGTKHVYSIKWVEEFMELVQKGKR